MEEACFSVEVDMANAPPGWAINPRPGVDYMYYDIRQDGDGFALVEIEWLPIKIRMKTASGPYTTEELAKGAMATHEQMHKENLIAMQAHWAREFD